MVNLVLASGSPRRKEILESLGLRFEVISPEIDESVADHLGPEERVQELARLKALEGRRRLGDLGDRVLLAADTLVSLAKAPRPLPKGIAPDGVLAKAADRAEAKDMVLALAGRRHEVHTGLALLRGDEEPRTVLSTSWVDFAPLSEAELEAYLDYGDWEGVAGAYRIQGYAARHITAIQGSWSGIVGLPIRELYVILDQIGLGF